MEAKAKALASSGRGGARTLEKTPGEPAAGGQDERRPALLTPVERAHGYRTLAVLFRAPEGEALERLRREQLPALRQALERVRSGSPLAEAARELAERLETSDAASLGEGFRVLFEEQEGVCCPPSESADAARARREGFAEAQALADVAGFYRAFAMEPERPECPDHLVAELEFMRLLAEREANGDPASEGEAAVCHGAARAFLRDHLVRWVPGFAARVEAAQAHPVYAAAARLLGRFVVADAALHEAR